MSDIATKMKNLKMDLRANKRVSLSRSKSGTFFIFLFLALICAFMALPIIYLVIQSLKPIDEIFAFPPKFFVKNPTFDNFKQVFTLSNNLWVPFSRYLFNSFFVAIVGTSFYVFISSLAAYPLAKVKLPGGALISQLVVWTLLFRAEVTAIPQYVIISKLSLVNTYSAIILPAMAGTMGVFLMKQFMVVSIPDSTLEAARIDGCGEMRIFFKIVMPSVKPALLTLIIFTFQTFWNVNSTQYIYSENLKQLPTVLSSIAAGGMARSGAAAAVSVILMIPPVVIFIISQSSVVETMTHSGLK